ncbi:hypothetical protein KY347_05575 [Candidatus Woesearchaeota archaeon]|nr:hypothetical protein [Candidatus Woesearchaeota archaeon]
MGILQKSEQSPAGWIFLLISIVIFAAACLIKPSLFLPSVAFAFKIIEKLILIFILVFVLMVVTNYFVSPQKLVKYFGSKKSIKGWLIAIAAGILSSGPIYMWYPLLSDLQKQGVEYGFIAAFLYNRAVKIPLLPVMILYFGLNYVIVLTAVMVFISVLQGLAINLIMEEGT